VRMARKLEIRSAPAWRALLDEELKEQRQDKVANRRRGIESGERPLGRVGRRLLVCEGAKRWLNVREEIRVNPLHNKESAPRALIPWRRSSGRGDRRPQQPRCVRADAGLNGYGQAGTARRMRRGLAKALSPLPDERRRAVPVQGRPPPQSPASPWAAADPFVVARSFYECGDAVRPGGFKDVGRPKPVRRTGIIRPPAT